MIDAKEQEFLSRLRTTFRAEAEEHLRSLSAGLIDLEKTVDPKHAAELVEIILREAHSLKGAARSVNLSDIESICQPLESLLVVLKRGEISVSPALFDLLHQAVDSLGQLVATVQAERSAADRAGRRDLSRRLVKAAQGVEAPGDAVQVPSVAQFSGEDASPMANMAETAPAPEQADPAPSWDRDLDLSSSLDSELPSNIPERAPVEMVRIPITVLDGLLLLAEEMIQARLAAAQRSAELRDIQQILFDWKAESARWRELRAWQSAEAPQLVAAHLETIVTKVSSVSQAFEQDQRSLRHRVDIHLDAMKQILMLPVSTLVEVFPRLVRDLAREQGKDVDLIISGADIEVDKRILEQLKDPLIHLVRNSVDHGLEKPEVRLALNKPPRGKISLAFSSRDGRQVEILVSDDGAGVAVNRLKGAAVKAGLLTSQAAGQLSPDDALSLIFQSGLSTSAIITDISGRGLGLAIVREKVEKLGGTVSIDSRAGLGTTFCLALPLTLATFRGVLVRAREQLFVLPTALVERVVRVRQDDIHTIENRETIRLDTRVLALVKLADVLALPARVDGFNRRRSSDQSAVSDHVPVLILLLAEKRLAVQVDEVLAEEEVLVKGLGRQLRRVRNVSGATVLGAGAVVPVLNVSDLMASAARPGGAIGAPVGTKSSSAQIGRILVADDSITARTLLKNILETSGHTVTTAVDGADAFTRLHSDDFDLLVSDVDMPRMSGFELTTKVRADKKLSEMPVVLVTALESRQDRERGIEVGANAYIIKSSFDQSNLLEVIHRLI